MKTSSRKGARITVCCALLLMHAVIVVEVGSRWLPFYFNLTTAQTKSIVAAKSSSTASTTRVRKRRRPEQSHTNGEKRRILSGTNNGKATGDRQMKHDESITQRQKRGEDGDFIDYFEDALNNDGIIDAATETSDNFAALIVQNNRVYCREDHMKTLSRGRYFVQMLRRGLLLQLMKAADEYSYDDVSIPILMKHDDGNGCYPQMQKDKYGFPRLTWSIPVRDNRTLRESPTSSSPWCWAVGMPSYKTWRDVNHHRRSSDYNNRERRKNEVAYPWVNKIPKAVWRGATTFNNAIYGSLPLEDVPRSRVVMSSLIRPDLIDAGFHKLVGRYNDPISHSEKDQSDVDYSRMLKESIPLVDMMRYKAIIDIDGNNWSARFQTLLCGNSVVIKITPDFTEQYYGYVNEPQPNVHYIPASVHNLTEVVEYAMDSKNDGEIRGVVERANGWCVTNRNTESLALEAAAAFGVYKTYLNQYIDDDRQSIEDWRSRWGRVMNGIDDLVECTV